MYGYGWVSVNEEGGILAIASLNLLGANHVIEKLLVSSLLFNVNRQKPCASVLE